jgi:hypothetical protein
MRRRLLIEAVVVLAVLLSMPIGIHAAHAQDDGGSIGIGLVDAPTDRRDDPRAHTYIVDHLHQGATITRHVQITSTVAQPTTVQLYVAAATLEGGEFVFGDGRAENDLTDWSSLDPPEVQVPANGSVQAAVTIAVPTDADDGERYGVIWAELPGSGGSANVVNRVGVRIYLSVGEGKEPVTDFTIDTLTAKREDDGTPVVETKVTNTGGRAIDLAGSLVLENGPGGLSTKPFDVQIGTTLAPGDSAPARVELDKTLPAGPWDATVTIQSGRVERTAKGSITFPKEPGETAKPVKAAESSTAKQRKVLIPVAAAAAVAAGGAGAAFLIGGRRRAMRAAGKAVNKIRS